jgi:uncharacterized phiE125 gp8 family phage protein
MTTRRIIEPAAPAVSLAAARTAARVDLNDDGTSPLDGDLALAIATYTAEAEHETGRAVIEQTWRVTLDSFPDAIELARPPLISVDHVKFYDTDGARQTLDPQDYLLDAESEPGYLVPAPGKAWPATAARINAVEVQCRCGYGADDSAVPAPVQSFILGRIQAQFALDEPPKTDNLIRLLWPLKVYS